MDSSEAERQGLRTSSGGTTDEVPVAAETRSTSIKDLVNMLDAGGQDAQKTQPETKLINTKTAEQHQSVASSSFPR